MRRRIERGEWAVGVMVPSRDNLAKEYGVALLTIQRAVGDLLAEGTLRAQDRRGTFVNGVPAKRNVNVPVAEPEAAHIGPPMGRRVLPKAATVGILAYGWETPAASKVSYSWERIICEAFEIAISDAGGSSIVHNLNTHDLPPGEAVLAGAERLIGQGVDALLIVDVYEHDRMLAHVPEIVAAEAIPLVCITWEPLAGAIPHIYYDSGYAAYQAAQHLMRNSCHDIVFVAPYTASWIEDRIAGARDAVRYGNSTSTSFRVFPEMRAKDPGYDDGQHRPPNYTPIRQRTGYEAMIAAIDAGLLPKAGQAGARCGLIAPNDVTAFGMMDAARDRGLIPGRDFALIGFDNDPRSGLRGLTSLRPPLEALGSEAASRLIDTLRGDPPGLQARIRSHVIARSSTGFTAGS